MEFNALNDELRQNNNFWAPITPAKHQSMAAAASEDNVNLGNSNVVFCNLNSIPQIPIEEEKQQIQSLLLGDNVDLSGFSFTQILGLATDTPQLPTTAIGSDNQFQFQSQIPETVSINYKATPGKEKESNIEVLSTNSKSKKRKFDEVKKPGEKRQKKFYWAKIDVPKTPAKPKTPKASKTPKAPKTPKAKPPKVVRKKQVKQKGKRALSFENEKNVSFEDGKRIEDEITRVDEAENLNKIKSHEALRVYRRRDQFKLQNECRRIEPNFQTICKRKMSPRIRRPVEKLKHFQDFSYDSIIEYLLDCFVTKKGKATMLLPVKEKIVQESFQCVWSLLSSPIKFQKKKRSSRKSASAGDVVKQPAMSKDALASSTTLQPCSSTHDNNEVAMLQNCSAREESVGHEIQSVITNEKNPSSPHASTSGSVDESKTIVLKGKKPRGPYKRKEKPNEELTNLKKWNAKSLEQKMDILVQHLAALPLYDDPKTYKMEVVLSEHNEDNENAKFKEESSILSHQMSRFLYVMTSLQGSKKFVPWNGSVLDSMIGVFLTQNVSDVLSSKAFMNLASRFPIKPTSNQDEDDAINTHLECNSNDLEFNSSQGSSNGKDACQPCYIVDCPPSDDDDDDVGEENVEEPLPDQEDPLHRKALEAALKEMEALPYLQGDKAKKSKNGKIVIDWEAIRLMFLGNNTERDPTRQDSVDWDAVRTAPRKLVANAIKCRGQFRIIAKKIQKLLNRLVEEHGTLDVEWLRDAPPQITKGYLLSFYGLGLKSVECLRLLTLHHHGFPVDVNIGRIAVRLGWVPLQPLPLGLEFHQLQKYPLENQIQQYLWPRIQYFPREFLYQLHCQMIAFGKIFCMKRNPNCGACPFKDKCKHYQSKINSKCSKNHFLPAPKSKGSSKKIKSIRNPFDMRREYSSDMAALQWTYDSTIDTFFPMLQFCKNSQFQNQNYAILQQCEPIVELPESPRKYRQISNNVNEETDIGDIEDLFKDDHIFVELSTKMNNNLKDVQSSKAIVTLSSNASISLPKHINVARLRTEHQVYELPFDHRLLKNLERQQGNIPYLLAIWMTQGETQNNSCMQEGCVDNESDCVSTVKGTILIPVRTAMRGSFPLNGTYFQANEVFADYETSENPIDVPTSWIWRLKKRTLYCGAGTSSIFRGLTVGEIKRCCCEGFVCTRAFDRRTRSPELLSNIFHNRPKVEGKGKSQEEDVEDEEQDD